MRYIFINSFLVFCVIVMLVASGCMAERAELSYQSNRCAHDSDCLPYSGVCDFELSACVSSGANTSETMVIAVSDPRLGVAGEHRFDLGATGVTEDFSLTVAEPVTFSGQVVDHREEGDERFISARITFRLQSQFEDLSIEPIYAESSESASQDELGELFNFQALLVPGSYLIEVEPLESEESTADQRYYPLRRICAIPSGECDTDFEYVDESGVIESYVVGPSGREIGGVRVYAYDISDGRRLSNTAVTRCGSDDDCGRFSIAVPEETDEFRLHLSGSEDNPLLPIMELGPYSFSLDSTDDRHISFDDGEISELSFAPYREPPVIFNAVIEGLGIEDGAQRVLVGTEVTIRSAPDDMWSSEGVFEFEATTNEQGALVADIEGLRDPETGIGIRMIPGEYDVTIEQPEGSENVTSEKRIVVEPPGEDEEIPEPELFVVGARAVISGVVTSPNGWEVPQVQIEAVSETGQTFSTRTDEVGFYELYVDRTVYSISVIPPDGSLLAWSRVVGVSALDNLSLDLSVAWGTPISGGVTREATDEPVESALVEGYVIRDGDPDGGPRLVPIGQSLTLSDGRFVFLLPERGNL